ncbi:MAG TPA: hypothetical protein QF753_13665 [Victivallales bacterium]|nr:hypothetical protein [Victivallales bacterium]
MKLLYTAILILSVTFLGCASKSTNNTENNTPQGQSSVKQSTSPSQQTRKAKIICPKCKKNGVPIVYGKPGRKTLKKAEEGKVYLGGCVKTPNSPKNHCYHCGNNW